MDPPPFFEFDDSLWRELPRRPAGFQWYLAARAV